MDSNKIRNTNIQVVLPSCDNCRHQIGELSGHYGLYVQVMGLAAIMVKART